MAVHSWLTDRNLAPNRSEEHLADEALTYAVVTYAVSPNRLPDEMLQALAQGLFADLVPQPETH